MTNPTSKFLLSFSLLLVLLSGCAPTVNPYNNVLTRTPDAGGLAFWQDKLSNGGWATADVLGYFSTSAENVTNVTPLIANGISYTQFVG